MHLINRERLMHSATLAALIVVLFVGHVLLSAGCASTPGDAPGPRHDLTAETYSDLKHRYHESIGEASAEELARMAQGELTGLAIAAAWEQARRNVHSDESALQSFVAVAEAQLPVDLPNWWKRGVLHADVRRPDAPSFFPYRHVAASDRQFGRSGIAARPGLAVEVTDEALSIRSDTSTCTLPRGLVTFSGLLVDALDARWVGQTCYVLALNSADYDPPRLYRYDCDRGELVWHTQIHGAGPVRRSGGATGTTSHWMELTLHEERLYVFGMKGSAIYIEAFDLATGDAQFRFGTIYLRDGG